MGQTKLDFEKNVKNYVERGDCGHEGLEFQFEESNGILYFANIADQDYPQKTLSEMYVDVKGLLKRGHVTFEYMIPGKLRQIEHVPIRNFYEYIY